MEQAVQVNKIIVQYFFYLSAYIYAEFKTTKQALWFSSLPAVFNFRPCKRDLL